MLCVANIVMSEQEIGLKLLSYSVKVITSYMCAGTPNQCVHNTKNGHTKSSCQQTKVTTKDSRLQLERSWIDASN